MRTEEELKQLILSKKIEIDNLEYINNYCKRDNIQYDNKIRRLRHEVDILEEIIYF
jgi:hypothetical protein